MSIRVYSNTTSLLFFIPEIPLRKELVIDFSLDEDEKNTGQSERGTKKVPKVSGREL